MCEERTTRRLGSVDGVRGKGEGVGGTAGGVIAFKPAKSQVLWDMTQRNSDVSAEIAASIFQGRPIKTDFFVLNYFEDGVCQHLHVT
jgi:hypothetical protein